MSGGCTEDGTSALKLKRSPSSIAQRRHHHHEITVIFKRFVFVSEPTRGCEDPDSRQSRVSQERGLRSAVCAVRSSSARSSEKKDRKNIVGSCSSGEQAGGLRAALGTPTGRLPPKVRRVQRWPI